jgi:hypothetical protein
MFVLANPFDFVFQVQELGFVIEMLRKIDLRIVSLEYESKIYLNIANDHGVEKVQQNHYADQEKEEKYAKERIIIPYIGHIQLATKHNHNFNKR